MKLEPGYYIANSAMLPTPEFDMNKYSTLEEAQSVIVDYPYYLVLSISENNELTPISSE